MELQENFIGSSEASKLLGVHRYTLNRWILNHRKDKNFKCPTYYCMGGRVRVRYKFKKSEINNFINEYRSLDNDQS